MTKIKWSDFLNPAKRIAINCQTEEDARVFLEMLSARGVKSRSGVNINWYSNFGKEESRSYCIIGRCHLHHADESFYIDNFFAVYNYSEVEFIDGKDDKTVENNKGNDLMNRIAMALDQLKDLQEEAEKKQEEYKDSFVQWAVFQERTAAYKTAVMLIERAIKND